MKSNQDLRRLVRLYRKPLNRFTKYNHPITARRTPDDDPPQGSHTVIAHVRWIMDDLVCNDYTREVFIQKLAFIQGILWSHGIVRLSVLEKHAKLNLG